MSTLDCADCGTTVKRASSTQKRCRPCATQHEKRLNQQRRARRGVPILAGRVCDVCNSTYDARGPRQRTCSVACASEHKRRYMRNWSQQTRGHVPLAGRACSVCGSAFDAAGANQKYCGRACASQAELELDRQRRANSVYVHFRHIRSGLVLRMRRMGLDPAHTVSVDTLVTLWERMGGICPCGCERPMALDAANRHDRPSVEQVFPGQGYMPGNVSILRLGCNVELRDLAPERLRQLADFREALQRAALRVRDAA